MNRLIAVFIFVATLPILTKVQAENGTFGKYIVINSTGGGQQFIAATSSSNIGTFSNGTLTLQGGEISTYQNGSDDMTGVTMFYRVYEVGATAPSFSSFNLPQFGSTAGNGDKKWQSIAQSINLILPSSNGKTYKVEFYYQIFGAFAGSPFNYFDSNSSANYAITYSISGSLPIQLSNFSTKSDIKQVNLIWQTASETNNAFFEVERSADVKVWETLARIDGKGTTAERQTYAYLDQTPRKGINYYRLKQVDTDGTFAYSRVRDAVIERNPDANVYPNPVSDLLRISGISEAAEVNIMDLLGNTKFQKTIQRDSDIDLKGFSEGVYLVRITDETATKVRKIRVLR